MKGDFMSQEFKLTNGDGYFTVMDEVDLKNGRKWRTVALFTSIGITKFDDIIIKPEDDEALIVKALAEKLQLDIN
jgi:hypothetical protein